jgi:hypothetical protein
LCAIFAAACSGANDTTNKNDLSMPATSDLTMMQGMGDMAMMQMMGDSGPPMGPLVINEVSPHGSDPLTDPDFAEIKNIGGSSIDLSGYKISDDKTTAAIPMGVTIAPGGYVVILCDDAPDGGPMDGVPAPFKLGGSGDAFTLAQPDGTLVDTITWGATTIPKPHSYCRLPDGTGQFAVCTPTKGAPNMM